MQVSNTEFAVATQFEAVASFSVVQNLMPAVLSAELVNIGGGTSTSW